MWCIRQDWCRLYNSPLQDCSTLQQVYERHVLPDREANVVDSYEEGFMKASVRPGQALCGWPVSAAKDGDDLTLLTLH